MAVLERRISLHGIVDAEILKFLVFLTIEFQTDELKPYFQKSMARFLHHCLRFPVNSLTEVFLKYPLIL
jgi:hypothetical protein